jgi:hypothetical protein
MAARCAGEIERDRAKDRKTATITASRESFGEAEARFRTNWEASIGLASKP